jgi:hypothetical protein
LVSWNADDNCALWGENDEGQPQSLNTSNLFATHHNSLICNQHVSPTTQQACTQKLHFEWVCIALSTQSISGTNTDLAAVGNQKAENVNLADIIGIKPTVLFFYPKDNTAGCVKEVRNRISQKDIEVQTAWTKPITLL